MADNITLGRGEIYFSPFTPGTTTLANAGFDYFGNTPAFSLSIETNTLDHVNSDRGINVKDLTAVLETKYSASMECDNIAPKNLAKLFLGSSSVLTQASATGATEVFTAEPGLRYILADKDLTTFTLTDGGSTTYVAGTDYEVDLESGDFLVIDGGAITSGSSVTATYDAPARSIEQVISGRDAAEGAMWFKAFNATGKQFDYRMDRVVIRPNGEFALKGDDWQKMAFTVEILELDSNTPAIKVNGRAFS